MKQLLTTSHKNLIHLKQQLTDFGLHPSDWSLHTSKQKKIRIQNKMENSFYFIGDLEKKNGQIKWKSIHLASL